MSINDIRRSKRDEQEHNAQLVLIGMLLVKPELLDLVEYSDFISDENQSAAKSLKAIRDSSESDGVEVHETRLRSWMHNQCGVSLKDGERSMDGLLRIVKSNSRRKAYTAAIALIHTQAHNFGLSDEEYEKKIVDLLGNV